MKSSHKYLALGALVVVAVGQAELAQWVQHVPGGSALEAIFFRSVALPSGPVLSRRPPRETVAELTRQIVVAPSRADLVSLRAREAELNLDFGAAEQDWKTFARLAADKSEGAMALADYYHRRMQPAEELAALLNAAAQPSAGRDALNPPNQQRSWKLFERALALTQLQQMPSEPLYEAWIARYPNQPQPYQQLFDHLISRQATQAAGVVIDRYAKAFPEDEAFPLQARARVLPAEQALKLYEQRFRPVMPPAVISEYFQLLTRTRNLRTYLANARAAVIANPNDLNVAARLFYYYQQQGNLPQAHRALLEYRQRRKLPTAEELLALATLFEQTNNFAEAAKSYQELSQTPAPQAEEGFAGLIRVLFTAPEQPIPIGSGDISFYKDIATMDPYPGTLNGILSLLFNSTDPRWRYSEQEQAAIPYFHRLKAAELLQAMEKRFPRSPRLPELQSMLLQAYARHGENDEVIKRGQQFLSSHPNSQARTAVWLLIADAQARANRIAQEFAVYDALLKELAANAQNVPLGTAGDDIPAAPPNPNEPGAYAAPPRPKPVRSARYAEVLDRYINRLVSLKRVKEALVLYRREIDRNPNDPGLYERLAEFLNQNRMTVEIEQVYTRATQQFQDRSWHHKLARWYLRQKQTSAFEKLTQSVVTVFSGTELDTYFQQVVANANLDAALYRQVNLYAHRRFPHDLVFVHNLLNAYQRKGTADPNAYLALLRQHWYHDSELCSRFFEHLSSTGKLESEIAALRSMPTPASTDRAVTQMIAGAEIWRSRFEEAVPLAQRLAADYPANHELNTTASSLFRSLGQTEAAAQIAERLSRSAPRDLRALTLVGEIYADREQFDKARNSWNRLGSVQPGSPDGYLESATVFWDYYLYDDAVRVIEEGRAKLRNPAAFAYEAGVIFENKRDYSRAIAEYMKGAQADVQSPSRRRLVHLAGRPAHRDAIEAQTRSIASGPNPPIASWNLRVALFEEQNRRDDIAALLSSTARSCTDFDLLSRVEQVAERNGLPEARELAIQRQITLTPDPVEKTRLRLMLARLAEERKDLRAARQAIDAAYKENPAIAGVVRSVVDYYWRSGDRSQAIGVLEEAASRSNPAFKRQFTLEAARKATESTDYVRARRLLGPMLSSEPLAADLVAAMAESYGRAGDDAGLRAFYSDRLKLAAAPDQQSALRRGLIPVLTRMKDYRAAIDEYIAILGKFPEDEALTVESARYARRHGVSDRLTAYYAKASADSPRDARWPILLARTQAAFEDLPAAVDSYSKALAIRPDRSDLLLARAGLEERLMRFEEASRSYSKLYDLTYKDPEYMVKVAEARARLGQKGPAIDALRTAFLQGKAAKADAYIEIASKLDQWGWLTEANQYVTEGRNLDAERGVALQARILTRLRQYAGLSSEEAIQSAALVVRDLYTPEEKAAFGAWLLQLSIPDKARFALIAGLQDVAVRDLDTRITANPSLAFGAEGQQLIQIQQQRLMYDELAGQLERFWRAVPPGEQRDQLLTQAAENWRWAANPREELRIRQILFQQGSVPDPTRYAELLFKTAPERFVQAGIVSNTGLRDAVTSHAYHQADPAAALRIIALRGAKQPPVWGHSYTALTGVYFNRRDPAITNAFTDALGPRTVGEQIAAKADRNRQLVGDVWFYYGARYGEFTNSEEYLASELEGRPASAGPYIALGDHYRDANAPAKALDEYARALQIDPGSAETHNRTAEILWAQKKTAEAQAHWRDALRLWTELQDRRVPEAFWPGVAETIEKAGPALRPEIDKLLRTYIRRNGAYRFDPLLAAIWKASATPADAARWVADLSSSAAEPGQFLASIVNEELVETAERELLFAKLLEIARAEAERRVGDARSDARWRFQEYQLRYLRALITTRQYTKAAESLHAIPAVMHESMRHALIPIDIEIAAATGQLDSILIRDDIDAEQLRQAAAELRRSGYAASARRLLDLLYTRELDRNNLDPSNFLGLAEVKLESGDAPGAVALLRRMSLVSGEAFDTLIPAADLLTRFNRKTEAIEFLEARVKAVPWDKGAETRLAIAKGAVAAPSALDAAMSAPDLATRIRLLRAAIATNPESSELRVQLFRALYSSNRFEEAIGVFRDQIPPDVADRGTLARDLASAYQKLGRLEATRRFLVMAPGLELRPNTKAEVATIDAELRRVAENNRRMPRVHDGVDQTERVRPRL